LQLTKEEKQQKITKAIKYCKPQRLTPLYRDFAKRAKKDNPK